MKKMFRIVDYRSNNAIECSTKENFYFDIPSQSDFYFQNNCNESLTVAIETKQKKKIQMYTCVLQGLGQRVKVRRIQ